MRRGGVGEAGAGETWKTWEDVALYHKQRRPKLAFFENVEDIMRESEVADCDHKSDADYIKGHFHDNNFTAVDVVMRAPDWWVSCREDSMVVRGVGRAPACWQGRAHRAEVLVGLARHALRAAASHLRLDEPYRARGDLRQPALRRGPTAGEAEHARRWLEACARAALP